MFRRRLIAPGPVEISPDVQRALALPQLHHRSPEAKEIVLRARALLRVVAGLPESSGWEPLIVTASATGAFEAVLGGLLEVGSVVLSASCGKFGERWADMARTLGHSVFEERLAWGQVVTAEVASSLVRAHPEARAFMVTHSETSAGTLNDLEQIVKAIKAINPNIVVLVDAVTSLGMAELRPDAWGVDAVISGSQKAVGAPPGLGFVFLSPRALEIIQGRKSVGYYFDLKRELKMQAVGETANTPAINLIVGVNAALEPICAEIETHGLEAHWLEKKTMNDALLAAALALGCTSFTVAPSPACVTLVPPAPITGKQLVKALLARNARAQGGQDAIKDTICRISFMGYFDRYDCIAFAGLLEDALLDCGATFARGVGVQAAWRALNPHLAHAS